MNGTLFDLVSLIKTIAFKEKILLPFAVHLVESPRNKAIFDRLKFASANKERKRKTVASR